MDILLVDDNRSDAVDIQSVLSIAHETSFRFHVADSIEQSLGILSEKLCAAILLNINLQDTTGIATLDHMRQAAGEIPVVILVGDDDRQQVHKAARHGAEGILVKSSITPLRLTRMLSFVLARNKKEQMIRYQEKKYRTFIEELQDAYYELDTIGVF